MPLYLNAVVMLVATLAAFVVLSKLAQQLRGGRLLHAWTGRASRSLAGEPALIRIEQSCVVDGKRRLVAVRCGDSRVILLTGGPADLVVSRYPLPASSGDQA